MLVKTSRLSAADIVTPNHPASVKLIVFSTLPGYDQNSNMVGPRNTKWEHFKNSFEIKKTVSVLEKHRT
jgi:hypothetical protein